MQDADFKVILRRQKQFFKLGTTFQIDFRIQQLTKLKDLIKMYESEIIEALKLDLNKSPTESLMSELMLINSEIDFAIKNIRKWSKPRKVPTPFPQLWPGKSFIHNEPYGSVLIISPWNYPFLLILAPLVGVISAGNCAVIKPSEISTHSEKLLTRMINGNFPQEYITVVNAGLEKTSELLAEKFDYIFYVGGTAVGKIVMEAAAKHLTPVTLELGGKNPCIIDKSADIDYASRRIIWTKFMNAGQTCIAPDYLLVDASCKKALIDKLIAVTKQFYGDNPQLSESYGRIISKKQFLRLKNLLKSGNILLGGDTDAKTLYISPTIIDGITYSDPIMQEEIFGPILPIITYEDIHEVLVSLSELPHPLALYLFTQNSEIENKVLKQVKFGGGCVNDCVMQIANINLPFGGVGQSGMGCYHGKYSFETFSHHKYLYKKSMNIDFRFLYPPYSSKKLRWIKRLLF